MDKSSDQKLKISLIVKQENNKVVASACSTYNDTTSHCTLSTLNYK